MMTMPRQGIMSHGEEEGSKMAALAAEEDGVEVVGWMEHMFSCSEEETSEQPKALAKEEKEELGVKKTFGYVSPSRVKTTNDIVERSSHGNSPRSQLDFDVMATRDDSDKHMKMNHSHNAYEIQRKTQAMRELDLLSGDDDYSDGTESVSMSSSSDGSEPKEIKIGRRRPAQHKARENDWLFSCTLDDIDEVVEELISPFDSTIENIAYFSCQRDNDDSITDNEERL